MNRKLAIRVMLGVLWVLGLNMANAQSTGCALNPRTVTVTQTLGSAAIDVGLVVTIWCGTSSTRNSQTINGTLTGPGANGNLTRSGGTDTVAYSVFRGTSVVTNVPATPTSCTGMTAWTNAVNFSVSVTPGSFSIPVVRYMTMCIRISAATSRPPGSYTASPGLTVAPYQSGAMFVSITGTQTINITGNIPGTCTVQTAPSNITLAYPAFSTGPVVQTTTSAIRCTSGLPWSAAVSPASGTLRGITYSIAISSPSTASGTGTGNDQSLTITATTTKGQTGTTANCPSPCSISHTLTITY